MLAELIEKPFCLARPALGGSTQPRLGSTVSPITDDVVALVTLRRSAVRTGKSDGIASAGDETVRARRLTADFIRLDIIKSSPSGCDPRRRMSRNPAITRGDPRRRAKPMVPRQ